MTLEKIINNKVIGAAWWYLISEFFVVGLSFLTLPIFTRILSTSEFGSVALYNSIVNITTILIGLSFPISVARAKIDFKENYNDFISSLFVLNFITFFMFATVVLIFIKPISILINIDIKLIYLLLAQSFSAAIIKLFSTKMKYEYRFKSISILNILIALSGVVISILLINTSFSSSRDIGRIVGQSSISIVVAVILIIYILIKGRVFINLTYWKYALTLSLPLVIHELSGIINTLFDRILISRFLGNYEAGIYSFAYNIGLIISVILIATNQAINPWFFENMENNEFKKINYFSKIYRNYFTLVFICILYISPEVIKFIAPREYWSGIKIVPLIFIAYYLQFLITFETRVEHYTKKTHLISTGTIISAITNIMLNIIFIPIFGYIAAAYITIFTFGILLVIHFVITTRIIKINIYGIKFYSTSLLYVIISVILYYILEDYIYLRLIVISASLLLALKYSLSIIKKHL